LFTGGGEAASIISASGVTIATHGDDSIGAYSVDSTINLVDTGSTTTGDSACGAFARRHRSVSAIVNLIVGAVYTEGDFAHGLVAEATGARIDATGTEVITTGLASQGVYALRAVMQLEDLTISTMGDISNGAYSESSQIELENATITTFGYFSAG